MKKFRVTLAGLIALTLVSNCARKQDQEAIGMGMFSEINLAEHIKFISHDLTEGRDTASRGEKIAQEYIATQYAVNGIQPGGDDGTYFQNFELVRRSPKTAQRFAFRSRTKRYIPEAKKDFIALALQSEESISLRGEVVFVGYGIEAPEFEWNDYKDLDIKGKVLLVLAGEPLSEDPDFFKGKENSDYAGTNYKLRTAGEKGAAGVLLVYDQKAVGAPWMGLVGYFSRPRLILKHDRSQPANLKMGAFISAKCAEGLADLAGQTLKGLHDKANEKEFQPEDLGIGFMTEIESGFEPVACRNVIGIVPGKVADEYVLYTAHTDHLGIGRPEEGDRIYNGAVDNASGCASLIEIGRVFASLPSPPERSIILACVTAEEVGLLGSKYYAQNPPYPLNRTLAVINLDGQLPWGKASDFVFIGAEKSSLGDMAEEIAGDNGMTVSPDIMPEENFYRRSDHYSLAQEGVPGGMLINGFKFVGKPEAWGLEELKKWLTEVYHHPTDEFSDDWKMETIVQVNQIAFQFGYRIARLKEWPTWNADQEFRKIREKSLAQ